MAAENHIWKGYTLDEIRVHRIVNLTKIELERTRLSHLTENYTHRSTHKGSNSILTKLMGALDYVDYGILAYKLGKSIFAIFRRKK